MAFFDLLRREATSSLAKLLVILCISGVTNTAMIVAINVGAQSSPDDRIQTVWAVSIFVISLLLFMQAQNYILITATSEVETIIHKLRLELLDRIRSSELREIEGIGRSRIIATVANDTQMLTQATRTLALAGQGVLLVFFISLYVAFISFLMFAMCATIILIAVAIFHLKGQQIREGERQAAEWRRQLLDRLADVLGGFKEIRLNRNRSEAIYSDSVEISRRAANTAIWKEAENYKRIVFSQSAGFLLLGAVVFVAPLLNGALGSDSLTKATTAVLFATGACFGLVQSIPVLQMANAASERINRLSDELDTAPRSPGPATQEPSIPGRSFDRLEFRDVSFVYGDPTAKERFLIGPLNFAVERGEVVIITGGNGSGKSTFLKLLAGLYSPREGAIRVDGTDITNANRDAYRQLFAAVFMDYHLFSRLYGIAPEGEVEFPERLAQFELQDKTDALGGTFRTLDLSGGQRKRLALIVALLEHRPILILDEWTADQDPYFRGKFYNEILPALHGAGVTLVLVTHDDRHLDSLTLPARRLHMHQGRFIDPDSVGGA